VKFDKYVDRGPQKRLLSFGSEQERENAGRESKGPK